MMVSFLGKSVSLKAPLMKSEHFQKNKELFSEKLNDALFLINNPYKLKMVSLSQILIV